MAHELHSRVARARRRAARRERAARCTPTAVGP